MVTMHRTIPLLLALAVFISASEATIYAKISKLKNFTKLAYYAKVSSVKSNLDFGSGTFLAPTDTAFAVQAAKGFVPSPNQFVSLVRYHFLKDFKSCLGFQKDKLKTKYSTYGGDVVFLWKTSPAVQLVGTQPKSPLVTVPCSKVVYASKNPRIVVYAVDAFLVPNGF